MKLTIILLFVCTFLQAQLIQEEHIRKKNSIGLTINSASIGNSNLDLDFPTIGIEYRHLIKKSELRLSFAYQRSDFSDFNNSFRLAAGLNRILYSSPKIHLYAGGEIGYNNFTDVISFSNNIENITFGSIKSVDLNLRLGMEYSPTTRIGLFIEPKLFSVSIFEAQGGFNQVQTDRLKWLKDSTIGLRYKF